MTRDEFRSFYEQSIIIIAKEICQKNNSAQEAGNSTIVLCLKDRSENADSLYEDYIAKKNMLKLVIKGSFYEANGTPFHLDHHKLAACLTWAVASARLIYSPSMDEPFEQVLETGDLHRANEELAFRSGINFLIQFMIDNESDPKGKENLLKTLDEKSFCYPEPLQSVGYFDSAVRGLFFSSISYGINPILLANVFFLLETQYYLVNRLQPPLSLQTHIH